MYQKYFKRFFDIICATMAILVFGWLYLLVALLVRIKLGKPVIFKQPRPGKIDPATGKECIFNLYKFRTMTNKVDESGNLLPDEQRLTRFGKMLRATSLDELPEAFNILKGDMSVIGPRPQLVRDMVFMTEDQRKRHMVRPGLSGLAQVMGRNSITWEQKLSWDLEYLKNVSFWKDVKLILLTVKKVFIRRNLTQSDEETDLTLDFGDALLRAGKVSKAQYDELQTYAQELIEIHNKAEQTK